MSENKLKIYWSIVHEIHLASSSGDDTARLGLPGMISQKEKLEADLGLRQGEQLSVFEHSTANSTYRRQP